MAFKGLKFRKVPEESAYVLRKDTFLQGFFFTGGKIM
jgi:hypothetical protein